MSISFCFYLHYPVSSSLPLPMSMSIYRFPAFPTFVRVHLSLSPFSSRFFALPLQLLPEVDPTRALEMPLARFAALLGLELLLVGTPALALILWRRRRRAS